MKLAVYKDIPFLIPSSRKVNADCFSYWWFNSLRSSLSYTEQLWYIHNFVTVPELKILELFAEMGVSTAPLKKRNIKRHFGIDRNEENLETFKCVHEHATVFCGDTYTIAHSLSLKDFNYILAEYNALTTYRALQDSKESRLFSHIFASEVQYITYVDSAKIKEHLHYDKYSKFFDSPIYDSNTYIEGVANYLKRKFNYGLKAAAYDSINYTFLLERGEAVKLDNLQDTRLTIDMKQYREICNDDNVQ